MSCGLEHLSNCHGEVTMITMGAGFGMLWLRRSWTKLKNLFFPVAHEKK